MNMDERSKAELARIVGAYGTVGVLHALADIVGHGVTQSAGQPAPPPITTSMGVGDARLIPPSKHQHEALDDRGVREPGEMLPMVPTAVPAPPPMNGDRAPQVPWQLPGEPTGAGPWPQAPWHPSAAPVASKAWTSERLFMAPDPIYGSVAPEHVAAPAAPVEPPPMAPAAVASPPPFDDRHMYRPGPPPSLDKNRLGHDAVAQRVREEYAERIQAAYWMLRSLLDRARIGGAAWGYVEGSREEEVLIDAAAGAVRKVKDVIEALAAPKTQPALSNFDATRHGDADVQVFFEQCAAIGGFICEQITGLTEEEMEDAGDRVHACASHVFEALGPLLSDVLVKTTTPAEFWSKYGAMATELEPSGVVVFLEEVWDVLGEHVAKSERVSRRRRGKIEDGVDPTKPSSVMAALDDMDDALPRNMTELPT
jgi:hypothetical protein